MRGQGGTGEVKAGQIVYPEWMFPWLPSKYLNFIWVISTFRYILPNYIRHCETQQLQNLNHNKIPLDSSVCYHIGEMTGIAIMHEDTLAQWLVTIGKKQKNAKVKCMFC